MNRTRGLLLAAALLLTSGVILHRSLRRPSPDGEAPPAAGAPQVSLPDAPPASAPGAPEAPGTGEAAAVAAADAASAAAPAELPPLLLALLDGETGEPVTSTPAEITLENEAGSQTRRVSTDTAGQAALPDVAPGAYALQARCGDYLAAQLAARVTGSPGQVIAMRLQRGNELAGAVIDASSRPLSGAQIRAFHRQYSVPTGAGARTGADGQFRLAGLRAGEWSLWAHGDGYKRRSVSVTVPAPQPVLIELLPDPGFDVIVEATDGSPVAGGRVAIISRTHGLRGARSAAVTDAAGRARLWGLPDAAGEEIAIEARAAGHAPARRTLTASEAESQPVVLTLAPTVAVSGRVVDASGQPAPGVEVTLAPALKPRPLSLRTTSAGLFRLKDLEPGKYTIAAGSPALGASEPVELDVGSAGLADLTLTLSTGGGVIAGKVVDLDGHAVALCPVELQPASSSAASTLSAPRRRTTTGEDGSFRFEGLASASTAGRWTVIAGGGRNARVRQEAAAGSLDTRLVVSRLGSVTGFVSGLAVDDGGFEIQCSAAASPGEVVRTQRFSSASRWFRLRGLEPGSYTFSVRIAGEDRGQAASVEVRPGAETGPIELGASE